MKKMRLFSKTFLFTMLLMCIIILISHCLLYFLMPSVYVDEKNKTLTKISNQAFEDMENKNLDEILDITKSISENSDVNITITTPESVYAFSSYVSMSSKTNDTENEIQRSENIVNTEDSDILQFDPSVNNNIPSLNISGYSFISTNNTHITREKEILLEDGNPVQISFNMNLRPVTEASNIMFLILPYTITISVLISLCAAYLYARALTKPIKAICASAKEMENLSVETQCNVTSQDEIGELSQNINQLYTTLHHTIHSLEAEIDNVSKAEKMKVDFLRSASHELKTPLTSISIILENMILNIGKYKDHDTYMKKCKEIVDQLSTMIKDILDASSLDGTMDPITKETICLADWLSSISDPYLLIAKAKRVTITIDLKQSLVISTNPIPLQKAISNIIANAVQYTPEHHEIKIILKNNQLIIENECIPIKNEHLPHLTEAFYRIDFSRNKQTGGNGLGLYIIDQILTMLNLSYTFLPYENGMRFTINF